jgi:hypothetical protein
MEYRNFFIQDPAVGIGRGRDNYGVLAGYRDYQLGILNDRGNRTFNNTTDGRNSTAGSDNGAAMQWRGIEHYYAGSQRWCHGFNLGDTNGNCRVSLNPNSFADNTGTGYQVVGQISTLLGLTPQGGFNDQAGLFFFPQTGGTASTFVTDSAWSNPGWCILAVGGDSLYGSACGPWAFNAGNTSGDSFDDAGSLLSR